MGFQVGNLWDSNYQMVQNRPMPGRHFNFNLNFYL
jgi:iron complex outermembrane receptor protein